MKKYINEKVLGMILEFIQALIGIIGLVQGNLLFLLMIPMLVMTLSLCMYCAELKRYIEFVQFLMNNSYHNFTLLPRIRMYMQSESINNRLRIRNMSVDYKITRCNESEDLLGDMDVKYVLEVENKNLPDNFEILIGNDYSLKCQVVKYKYGVMDKEVKISPKTRTNVKYKREQLNHYTFALEKNKITQHDFFEIQISVHCDETFNYTEVSRDTIIFLPKLFGEKIENVRYSIINEGFQVPKFYCDAYRIHKSKSEFKRENLECKRIGSSDCNFEIDFVSGSGEEAYYFRIGLSDIDRDKLY